MWLWHKDREVVALRSYVLSRILLRRRSRLARPNICRLRALMRQTLPSTAAAVVQGEPVGDGDLVAADAAGEGMQTGHVIEVDSGDPGGQALAVVAVIISANAVTWLAVALSCVLRALTWPSWAVSWSVRWPGWLLIHRVTVIP